MGRTSFTQELKELAKASEGMDAGGCWREVLHLHRELGRDENSLGRAAWTMRYGHRGEWRTMLREAAAETLREARRAASTYDADRLRAAAGLYAGFAGCRFADAAAVMLKPGERATASGRSEARRERREHLVSEVRWVEAPVGHDRRREQGRRERGRRRRSGRAAA